MGNHFYTSDGKIMKQKEGGAIEEVMLQERQVWDDAARMFTYQTLI